MLVKNGQEALQIWLGKFRETLEQLHYVADPVASPQNKGEESLRCVEVLSVRQWEVFWEKGLCVGILKQFGVLLELPGDFSLDGLRGLERRQRSL